MNTLATDASLLEKAAMHRELAERYEAAAAEQAAREALDVGTTVKFITGRYDDRRVEEGEIVGFRNTSAGRYAKIRVPLGERVRIYTARLADILLGKND